MPRTSATRLPAVLPLAGLLVVLCSMLPAAAPAAVLPSMFAPTGAPSDMLGVAVASAGDVNGDGYDDVIVGAPRNDAGGADCGAAYVYFGGPTADDIADVTLLGAAAGDYFGNAVAGAGDVNGDGYDDVVVGAEYNDASGTSGGRAYVFLGGATMDATPDLTLTGGSAGDTFGNAVAGAGDVNGDGYDDVVVGAIANDAGGADAGRAYVYFGGASPDRTADMTLTGAAAGDWFGCAVGTAGDVNGDGYDDLIVGAYGNDAGGSNAGRAYVYYGGAAPNNVADLTLTGAAAVDEFGCSVGTAGDVNGDGYDDFVVGAYLNDAGGSNAGRAYVYYGGAVPNSTVDRYLTGAAAGDGFGISVGTAGDVNDDGYDDVIVGAWLNSLAGSGAGAAYVYLGGADLDAVADVTLCGEAADDLFGYAVAGAGDVNGDGRDDLVIGAYGNDAGGASAGRTYVLDMGPPPAAAHREMPTFTDDEVLGRLGNAVGTAGDVNGDGYDDLIVGEYRSNAGGACAGQAFIYFGGPAMDSIPDLTMTGLAAYDYFGFSVGTAGDVNHDGYDDWIVGAMQNDAGGNDAGAAYLYYGGATPNASADLVLVGAAASDLFGTAVGTAGDVNGDGYDDFLVGARYNDAGGTDAGRVYVYFGGAISPKVPSWVLTGAAAGDQFGNSAGTAGDVNGDGYDDVVVGAPGNGIFGDDAGAAYVYFGGASPDVVADVTTYGATAYDYYGLAVGTAGDMNGDGFADVVVGAPLSDVGGSNIGRAYIYWGGPTPDAGPDLALRGVAAEDQFGHAVGAAGDVNGDGYGDVIVGAYYNDTGGSTAGAAYVYYGGALPDTLADVTLLGHAVNESFGSAVGAAGDVFADGFDDVTVGAPYASLGGVSQSGAAYLYDFNRYFVTSPNGGETWTRNGGEVVTWLGAEPADLWLSVDDGVTYSLLQGSVGGTETNVAEVTAPDVATDLARVKAVPHEVWISGSDASDAVFTIRGPTGVEPGDAALRFRAPWPNPSYGLVRFGIELVRPSLVTVTVLDVAGREVGRPIAAEKFAAGKVTREWRPADLAPGVYTVRAVVGDVKLTRRLVWLGK